MTVNIITTRFVAILVMTIMIVIMMIVMIIVIIIDLMLIPINKMITRLERHRSLPSLQPFCPIIIKCTREVSNNTMLIMRRVMVMLMMLLMVILITQVAGFNSLADVLKRLDFTSAIRDVRRFQWVFSSPTL